MHCLLLQLIVMLYATISDQCVHKAITCLSHGIYVFLSGYVLYLNGFFGCLAQWGLDNRGSIAHSGRAGVSFWNEPCGGSQLSQFVVISDRPLLKPCTYKKVVVSMYIIHRYINQVIYINSHIHIITLLQYTYTNIQWLVVICMRSYACVMLTA